MEAIDGLILTFLIVDIVAIGILIYTYTPAGKRWTGETPPDSEKKGKRKR